MTMAATTTDHGKNNAHHSSHVFRAPVTEKHGPLFLGPPLHSTRRLRGAGYHCLSPREEIKAEAGRPPKVTWQTAKLGFF